MRCLNPAVSALAAAAILTLTACSDPVTAPNKQRPHFYSCGLMDDPDPGCTGDPADPYVADTVYDTPVAESHSDVSPTPDMPLWQGETNPYIPDYQKVCPGTFGFGQIFVYQGIRFYAPGPLVYTGPALGSAQYPGLPTGNYETTGTNQILSLDGRWELLGGVKIACDGEWFQVPRMPYAVWLGLSHALGGYGMVRSTSRGPSGGSGGNGWAYGGATVTVASGVGDGWQNVLDTFVHGGGCTAGWDVWVDGVQKCGNSS